MEIQLNQDNIAIVDDDLPQEIIKSKWYVLNGYVVRTIAGVAEYLHRLIMACPPGLTVDHKDQDKMNNRRSNLRICSVNQNLQNRGKFKNSTSRFKGVYRNQPYLNKFYWCGKITINGKQIFKRFPFTEEGELLAARWYDNMADQLFGEFAITNKDLGLL
jgi:hypothetical protein